MAKKQSKEKVDTYSYKGWLNSDSFWKRAFAILGYQMAATGVIYGIFLVFMLIIFLFMILLFGLRM